MVLIDRATFLTIINTNKFKQIEKLSGAILSENKNQQYKFEKILLSRRDFN